MPRYAVVFAVVALWIAVACSPQVPAAPSASQSAPAPAPQPAAQPADTKPAQAPAKAEQPAQPKPAAGSPSPAASGTVTVYSGREEKLISPLIERLKKETGLDVQVRYGDTAQLAAAILEEGDRSPADVYLAQDAGALGAVAAKGRLAKLPQSLLSRVEERFRSPQGDWVGVSGRARTVVYNTKMLREQDLPDSILDFADPKWKGKIGWAPTNGSLQAFVTALRLTEGEAGAKKWLQGVVANEPKVYNNNTAIVDAVGKGEVTVGFVNHYYLFRFLAERGEAFPARNYHPRGGGPGAMVNVAGVGILSTAKNKAGAERVVDYLLGKEAQQYFADSTYEYPLAGSVKIHPTLVPLSQVKTPKLDLGDLAELETTLTLLREVGAL